jgi:drug/metabolite transporter (DMT)-like permease
VQFGSSGEGSGYVVTMESTARESRPDTPLLGAVLLTLVLWASAFVAIRLAVREYPAGSFALLRFLVAGIGLALYQLVRPSDRIRLPARRHLPGLVMAGLVGITLYHVALNVGERTVTAGSASLIVSLSPIFTALFATVSLGERLAALGWAGVLTGFTGAALVSVSEHGAVRWGAGSLLVLIAAIAQAVYFVLQKPLLLRYRPLEVTSYAIWLGTIGLLPFAGELWRTLGRASPEATAAGIYPGLLPGAAAYLSWSYVLSRLPAGRAASTLYLVPPFAIMIAWLVLGEQPSRRALLGGSIVLLGVGLVNSSRYSRLSPWWGRRKDRFASAPAGPTPRSHR